MKKKIFKILSVIVFIILCVSVFCINASAFSGRKKIPFSSTFAIVHNDYGTVLKTANCVKQTDGAYRIDYWLRANDFPQYYITVDGSFDTSGLIGQTVDISFEVADVFDTWTPLENYNGDNSFLQCGDWISYPNALKTEDFTEGFSFVLKNVKITSNSTPFFMKLWFKSPDIGSLDEILTIYILQNAYVCSVDTSIKDSIDKSSTDIQANADKNANEIKANHDKNTDKILNGDSNLDSSGETGKVNGAVGDIDGATDEALGGKSETEIQGEVDGALDWNKIGNSVDFEKAQRMSTFYDRCLTVFGSKYNSLLLLSLILGLAAFLIGRKYG